MLRARAAGINSFLEKFSRINHQGVCGGVPVRVSRSGRAWPAAVASRTVAGDGRPNNLNERVVVTIAEMTFYHVRIPLRKAIRHASHSRTDTDNLLIRCVLDDRTEGWGEGVPRDYVTGETIDSDFALLHRSGLQAQLETCRDFAQAVSMAEQVCMASLAGDERDCQGNAGRCAVE